MKKEHIPGIDFVAMARKIIGDGCEYIDEMMEIRVNGKHIEITRKPMPEIAGHLTGSNPVTMADGNDVYRHHGEHCYLTAHMRKLCS